MHLPVSEFDCLQVTLCGWQGAEIQLQTVRVDNCQCFGHHCYVNFVCVYKRETVGVDVHERRRKCVYERERERDGCACVCLHKHPFLVGELVGKCKLPFKTFCSLSLSPTHTHLCTHT